jgi:hypothetical protein
VDGDLSLSFTDIKQLPKNLLVKGDLSIWGTLISFIPDDTQIGGVILGASKDCLVPKKYQPPPEPVYHEYYSDDNWREPKDDDDFCGSCQESPCACTDRERTSTTFDF